jgi:hypothetical protein
MCSGSTNRRAPGAAADSALRYDATFRQAPDEGRDALTRSRAARGEYEQGKHVDKGLAREREDDGAPGEAPPPPACSTPGQATWGVGRLGLGRRGAHVMREPTRGQRGGVRGVGWRLSCMFWLTVVGQVSGTSWRDRLRQVAETNLGREKLGAAESSRTLRAIRLRGGAALEGEEDITTGEEETGGKGRSRRSGRGRPSKWRSRQRHRERAGGGEALEGERHRPPLPDGLVRPVPDRDGLEGERHRPPLPDGLVRPVPD